MRCHVYLFNLYLSKLPVEAFIEDVFCMRLLAIIPACADMPWFLKNRLGQNSCSKVTSAMCEEAGISGRKTNPVYATQLPQCSLKKEYPRRSFKGSLAIGRQLVFGLMRL